MKSQTNIDAKDELQLELNTALYDAVHAHNLNLAIQLLKAGASPSTTVTLALAASDGQYDMVLLLLSYGSDPNKQDTDLKTPLYYATCNQYNNIIGLLLDFGAKPDILNKDSKSPLTIARSKDDKSSLETFLTFFNTKTTPLQKNKNVVFSLLDKESSRWFITYCERKMIRNFKLDCEKVNSVESLLKLIDNKMNDINSKSDFYRALQLSCIYLKEIMKLNKKAKDTAVTNPMPEPRIAPTEVVPTAPPGDLEPQKQEMTAQAASASTDCIYPNLHTQQVPISLSTEQSGEPDSVNEEPGLEEQIEGRSPLVKLSLLSNKTASESIATSSFPEKNVHINTPILGT